ncbi:MAG: DUF1045 domain-containing protein [Pseudomonadota bacterium]
MFTRYAIYYTPAAGTPLAQFGAEWLGWDSADGRGFDQPTIDGLDMPAITAPPRKYGFHGTLKPPFRLADGTDADALGKAVAGIAAETAPIVLEGLHMTRLGRFLALTPFGEVDALAVFAGRLVQDLDGFRAPPTEAELAKRRAGGLNPAQEVNLVNWGYPYVLDQFRFHLTLTGRLDAATADITQAAINERIASMPLAPYTMDGVTLLGEDAEGMFHQIHRYALTG